VIVRRDVTLPASREDVWRVVSDPSTLPRWWPGVSRVEDAADDRWTKVFSSGHGKAVRADFTRLTAEHLERLTWRQEVEESPFERILAAATTEILLGDAEGGTRVTIELDQRPRGWARFAPFQFRSAGVRQVQGALDGLSGLFGPEESS
jgi:uncharacterized protein YndB with AHSA1/START domain